MTRVCPALGSPAPVGESWLTPERVVTWMVAVGAAAMTDPVLRLVGLVASEDGTFLLKRAIVGATEDAVRLGRELGSELRRDSPASIFAG